MQSKETRVLHDSDKDNGDFVQAFAAGIANLEVGENLKGESGSDALMPDVSDEWNQKPSSQEEKFTCVVINLFK